MIKQLYFVGTSEMHAPLLHLNSPGLQGVAVVDGVVVVVAGS